MEANTISEKVFVSSRNVVTFTRPKCSKSKAADVSKYMGHATEVKIRAKCACGNTFRVTPSFVLRQRADLSKIKNKRPGTGTAWPGKKGEGNENKVRVGGFRLALHRISR